MRVSADAASPTEILVEVWFFAGESMYVWIRKIGFYCIFGEE